MRIIIITIKNKINKINTHISKKLWGIDSIKALNELLKISVEDFCVIVDKGILDGNELFLLSMILVIVFFDILLFIVELRFFWVLFFLC